MNVSVDKVFLKNLYWLTSYCKGSKMDPPSRTKPWGLVDFSAQSPGERSARRIRAIAKLPQVPSENVVECILLFVMPLECGSAD